MMVTSQCLLQRKTSHRTGLILSVSCFSFRQDLQTCKEALPKSLELEILKAVLHRRKE